MDYFAPMNQALNAYVQTGQQANQNLMDMQKYRAMQLQNDTAQMAYAKAKRAEDYQNKLNADYQSAYANPGTTQVPNPAYGNNVDAGLAQAQADNEGEWTPSAVAVMRQAQGLPDAGMAYQPQPMMEQANAKPEYLKFAIQHAVNNGAPQEILQGLHDQALKQADAYIKLGNPAMAAQFYGDVTGRDVQYLGKGKDEYMQFKVDEDLYKRDPMTGNITLVKSAEAKPKTDTAHNVKPVQIGGGMVQDMQYNPSTTSYDIKVGVPYKPTAQQKLEISTDKANKPKPTPPTILKALQDNDANMRQVERALNLATSNEAAFGAKNYAPDAIVQRLDKGGVEARAAVADIGSMIIKDRSGAAVTAAEMPRLKPFIPKATDDPATIKTKLERFREVLSEETQAMRELYTEGGYEVPAYKPPSKSAPAQKATTPPAPKVGAVQDGYKFRGGDPAKKENWIKVGK